MQKFLRGPLIYILLLVAVVWAVMSIPQTGQNAEEIDYSDFLTRVENEQVARVAITAYEIVGLTTSSNITVDKFPGRYDFKVQGANNVERIYRDLDVIAAAQTGKPVDAVTSADYSFVLSNQPIPGMPWYEIWGPYILLIACVGVLMFIFIRQQNGGNSKAMNFGRSRARLVTDDKKKITFAMVAGADEEKEELAEIVEFLKDPRKFEEMGARIPKGILLVGPPGTGKTYLSKAVAGEAGVPFFSISGSDFVEMFVGVGASRVRDLFDQAKKHAPSIVFIDEIDAVGRHRGAGLGGGHDEREQTLNQLLVEMDGFATNEGVIILAATNRPDILDPALLRPGRFDRQITVNLPDVKGREEILQVHAKGKPLGEDVELKVLAKRTHYFSPADLENVMNEAALLAARRKKNEINMAEFVEAITRVQMGPEKRSRVVTEKDRKLVAYHEAGHAIVLHYLEHLDEVHEVSIIPRGRAGGYTMALPGEDEYFITRAKLSEEIAMCMGGNAAEALVLGDITTGSTSDLRQASDIARRMIMEYGMNDKIGRMYLGGDREVFLGRDYGHARNYSEEMAASIDEEIQRMMDEGFAKATEMLVLHRDKLNLVADQLLEHEKLSGDEFRRLIENGAPDAPAAGIPARIDPSMA